MDIYDGAGWTEMDIDDLKAAIESGRSIEEAAQFLCRADSVDDVARKCEELGLKPKEDRAQAAANDPPYLAALLAAYPGLTREEALEMIKEAGG